MTLTAQPRVRHDNADGRQATPRTYLMCAPTYFDVVYAINEWMDPTAPVDVSLAVQQWSTLVETYRSLGHDVAFVDPVPGLPDMVFVRPTTILVFDRLADDQIAMVVEGQWRSYSLTLAWSARDEVLRLVCTFDMDPPAARMPAQPGADTLTVAFPLSNAALEWIDSVTISAGLNGISLKV